MAFESFTSSYAHGLRGTFDRVSSNPTSQKLQPPPAVWAQSVSNAVKHPLSYGAGGGPAKQKCQSGIAIRLVNPHTARELRTRRSELWCARIEFGHVLLTVPAPATALIAPQCRPLFDLGISQIDPFEAAKPESGLRSVPF